jgi:hypothetical protein
MSVICCVRDRDAVILGTDSRYVGVDFTTVVSDAEPKLFEIAPDTYLAVSGRKSACDFQREMAHDLSDRLHTVDVVTIASSLQQVMCAFLDRLVGRLRSVSGERTAQTLSGEALLHGAVMIGRNAGGQLVAVAQSYRVMGAQVVCLQEVHSGDHRTIVATCGAPLDQIGAAFSFTSDPTIWTDEPESVARRILGEVKAATIESGGCDQIVRVDGKGGRWLEKPPAGVGAPIEEHAEANITALISMTSPAISGGSIVGATLTLTANGVTTTINNATPTSGPFNAGAGIYMTRTSDGAFSAVTPIEAAIVHPSGVGFAILARSLSGVQDYGYLRLQQHGTSGQALLEATGLLTLTASGGTWGSLSANRLTLNGNIVVQGRQIGPGNPSFASLADAQTWCQNLLTALRTHGLIT